MSEHLIEKEEISSHKIIPAAEDRSSYWLEKLGYAVRLGNEFKGKTAVTFNTVDGPLTVFTTLWSFTEDYVQLKAGVMIPLNSIIDVHF